MNNNSSFPFYPDDEKHGQKGGPSSKPSNGQELPPWLRDVLERFGVNTPSKTTEKKSGSGENSDPASGGGHKVPPRWGSKSGNSKNWKPKFSPLTITLLLVALVAGIVFLMSEYWTEILWYQQVGFASVFFKQWIYFFAFGVLGVLLVALAVAINMQIAYRKSKKQTTVSAISSSIRRYRQQLRPLHTLVAWVVPLVAGVIFGGRIALQWQTILLAFTGKSFGEKDPQFGLDISFYVFKIPALQLLVQFIGMILILSAIVSLATYYLYGGISLGETIGKTKTHFTTAARVHISVLAALGSLLLGLYYWLGTYQMLLGNNQKFAGAGFTNINADLPARYILAIVSVLVAAIFLLVAWKGSWRLPVVALTVMGISGIVVGWAYPLIVQKFQVEPNAITIESPYIQRNIDATLKAYGMDSVEKSTYAAKTQATRGQLREDSESTASIRILDPNIVSPSFNQLQQNRQYYSFHKSLSVDRYSINNQNHDTVIAVREINLDGLGPEQRTWVNDHTVYTHGFGVVAAFGNKGQEDGRPDFFEEGIPSTGTFGEYEPRVYFGQQSPIYSLVGGSEGSEAMELDYPDDNAPNGQVNTTYKGDGGPRVGNFLNRLLYAIKFHSTEILFTDRVNSETQILYKRDPHVRVAEVAPYITLDNRAYPAVVDMDGDPKTPKRLVWVVDAYTTSDSYPYAAHELLSEATADSRQGAERMIGAPATINYIRNSVKAVVDAYDGKITLYKWGKNTPILDAWTDIFPGSVQPSEDIPADLLKHLRYPEDIFKVQRTLLARYHVTDAASFYSGGDFWKLPDDPTKRDVSVSEGGAGGIREPQPPYYLTLQMPGQNEASFSITSTYIPGGNTDRNVLTGFLAVDAEAAGADGKVNPNYGKLRLLELPRDLTVPGPGQVQNKFDSSPTVSTQLNLLRTGGSRILFGNQLTLPMGGGLLYVEPVYIQSSGGTSYPLLRYVLTAFGESIGFAPTIDESLDQLFGGDSGAHAGDAGVSATVGNDVDKETGTDSSSSPSGNAKPGETGNANSVPTTQGTSEPSISGNTDSGDLPAYPADGSAQQRLASALKAAQKAYGDGKKALATGDWEAYGRAQKELEQAITLAAQADQELRGR